MEEKSVWMGLFLFTLVLCLVLAFVLVRNSGGIDCKRKYDALKQTHIALADKHSKLLENLRTLQTTLKSKIPDYAKNEKLKQEIAPLETAIDSLISDTIPGYKGEEELKKEIVRLELAKEKFEQE